MDAILKIGENVVVSPLVSWSGTLTVGHCSYVGYPAGEPTQAVRLGAGVVIGAFCLVESGAQIGDLVEICHYSRIAQDAQISHATKILEGVHVHPKAIIGKNCIIGGDVPERTIIEDEVTFMGEIAHSHRAPTNIQTWDITDEASPVIRYGSVVGANALLIGGIEIGPQAYVAAGEIVRCDVPPRSVVYRGEITALDSWRGVIKSRG